MSVTAQKHRLGDEASLDALLLQSQVLVCAGSGGVGKTTFAAALAVRAAELGRRVFILTVDPAKRLATTLGIANAKGDVEVPGQAFAGRLFAATLDSKQIFDDFVRNSSASPELAERLMSNTLYQQLSTALSGSQEFTSLEKLHNVIASRAYDLVILDTPPTQHALDFLTAPQKIENLFQDSVTKWFRLPQGGNWFTSLLSQGTRQALKALENLTGQTFIETLVHFFASIQSLQHTLRNHSAEVREILTRPSTQFVLVTSFDAAKLHEAQFFMDELKQRHYHLGAVVINRAFPDWLGEEFSPQDSAVAHTVSHLFHNMREFYAERLALYHEFQKSMDPQVTVRKLPELHQEITALGGLQHIYGSLRP